MNDDRRTLVGQGLAIAAPIPALEHHPAGRVWGEMAAPGVPAEQHFPVSVVTLHGLLAVTTVVLVLLTALKVGGS